MTALCKIHKGNDVGLGNDADDGLPLLGDDADEGTGHDVQLMR